MLSICDYLEDADPPAFDVTELALPPSSPACVAEEGADDEVGEPSLPSSSSFSEHHHRRIAIVYNYVEEPVRPADESLLGFCDAVEPAEPAPEPATDEDSKSSHRAVSVDDAEALLEVTAVTAATEQLREAAELLRVEKQAHEAQVAHAAAERKDAEAAMRAAHDAVVQVLESKLDALHAELTATRRALAYASTRGRSPIINGSGGTPHHHHMPVTKWTTTTTTTTTTEGLLRSPTVVHGPSPSSETTTAAAIHPWLPRDYSVLSYSPSSAGAGETPVWRRNLEHVWGPRSSSTTSSNSRHHASPAS